MFNWFKKSTRIVTKDGTFKFRKGDILILSSDSISEEALTLIRDRVEKEIGEGTRVWKFRNDFKVVGVLETGK